MGKLHDVLKKNNVEFFQIDRMSLDNYYYEPFQDSDQLFEQEVIFETVDTPKRRQLEPAEFSLFRYFMDGSRKPYKLGDMITPDNRYVPVVAGQIGAACCYRTPNGTMKKHDIQKKNVLMVFDSIPQDILDSLEEHFARPGLAQHGIKVRKYKVDKVKDANPTNAAVAKIQEMMRDMEIDMLHTLVNEKYLLSSDGSENLLVIDGSLQFLTQHFNPDIFYNVVGISKSFDPCQRRFDIA